MAEAPLGSIISYWLRPSRLRGHIHRIEVGHALCLANANQAQIPSTLSDLLRHLQKKRRRRELVNCLHTSTGSAIPSAMQMRLPRGR